MDVTKPMVEKENVPETMQKTLRILHFTAYKTEHSLKYVTLWWGTEEEGPPYKPGLDSAREYNSFGKNIYVPRAIWIRFPDKP